MQKNDAETIKKRQGDDAVDEIESWNLLKYFFNTLKYANIKKIRWPRIDFTLNGQLLFRLELSDEYDDGDAESDGSLQIVLKYFGAQDLFVEGKIDFENASKCTFKKLPSSDSEDEDDEKVYEFVKCPIGKEFKDVVEDSDAVSKLCYAYIVRSVSEDRLKTVLACVHRCFKELELRAKGEFAQEYARAPEWSIEKLFYTTLHDTAAVATEINNSNDEKMVQNDDSANISVEKRQKLEEDWKKLNAEINKTKISNPHQIVSSCQLHSNIWQYNQKYNVYTIGRQYENIAILNDISTAMHVPHRGPDEELQKKIYIGEYLVKLLTTVCSELHVY